MILKVVNINVGIKLAYERNVLRGLSCIRG